MAGAARLLGDAVVAGVHKPDKGRLLPVEESVAALRFGAFRIAPLFRKARQHMRMVTKLAVFQLHSGEPARRNDAGVASMTICASQLYRGVVMHGLGVGPLMTAQASNALSVDVA
jgi:hypothetical protein